MRAGLYLEPGRRKPLSVKLFGAPASNEEIEFDILLMAVGLLESLAGFSRISIADFNRYYGADGNKMQTFKDIGKDRGVTGSRIMSSVARATRRLHHPRIYKKLKDIYEKRNGFNQMIGAKIMCDNCKFVGEMEMVSACSQMIGVPSGWATISAMIRIKGERQLDKKERTELKERLKRNNKPFHICPKCIFEEYEVNASRLIEATT